MLTNNLVIQLLDGLALLNVKNSFAKKLGVNNLGIFPYLGERNLGVHFVSNFINAQIFYFGVLI